MNKIIPLLILFILTVTTQTYSQSYIGWTKKKTNLREEPNSTSAILLTLNPGSQIFIVSLETIDGFYNVIDIETNTEGFVAESFVKVGDIIPRSTDKLFTPSGRISSYDPEVEIFNNTDLNLTLKLNESVYRFSPYEEYSITLNPGYYDFRASAPGVIPVSGGEELNSNMRYSWQFYVVTR